jgi:hypothetical protein
MEVPLSGPFRSKLHFLAVKRESDGEIFVELLSPLLVMTRIGLVEIPKGFISDGASIPKMARGIVGDPFELEYLAPAVVHDAFYRKGFLDHVSRGVADGIFKDLLWDTGVPKWKVPPFYAAVRAGGWRAYKKVSTISVIPKAILLRES